MQDGAKMKLMHVNHDAPKRKVLNICIYIIIYIDRDARPIAGQGGLQEQKGTEDHIQQICIIVFSNHVLLILLGTDFVLKREKSN